MVSIDWSLIEKVVYINLNKRPDRNVSIQREMRRVGIPQNKIIRFEAIEHSSGGIGCALSHAGVLAMAEHHHWRNVLILEDDMMFNDDEESMKRLDRFLANLKEINWDVGFLSASYFIIKEVKKELYKVEFAYLANSYIVNRQYYPVLIKNLQESVELQKSGVPYHESTMDRNWLQLMDKDLWYGVYPCTGYQKVDMSNIESVVMDRTAYFQRQIDEMRQYGSY